jgi:hypothetical protein
MWHSLTAWLYYRTSGSGVARAEVLETVSHDRLTSMLQGHWSGHTRLERTFRTLFVWERGSLILDETVMPKPFATAMESLAWVFSSQERKPVDGFSLVWLVWTHGTLRMPLGARLWRTGGPSKDQLALERLSYARHRLRCRPEYVLFEAWYPSKAILKRIHDDGWYCICRLKKNRRFNGQVLRTYRRHPYGAATGRLTGGLNVLVVRYGAKDLCYQPPDAGRRRGAAALSLPRPHRGGDERVQGSAPSDGLSSTLRAGAAASYHLWLGRLWRPGAGTA